MPNILPTLAPLGLTLPASKGKNGYFGTTTNVLTQVQTDLTSLLLTTRGERIMQPDFGCDLPTVLFNNSTSQGVAEVQATIQQAVQKWLPFVQVTAVNVTQNQDENSIQVVVAFALLTAQNLTSTIVLQFS